MVDFPRRRRCLRRTRRNMRKPRTRKVKRDWRRWPARRIPSSLTLLENTLLTTRCYVPHTSRAVLWLWDALVYFAHRRHRRSSSHLLPLHPCVLSRTRRRAPRPRGGRVRYFDASPLARTLSACIVRKATSPTLRQRGEDGSLTRSRLAFRPPRKSDYGRRRARPPFLEGDSSLQSD